MAENELILGHDLGPLLSTRRDPEEPADTEAALDVKTPWEKSGDYRHGTSAASVGLHRD